MGRKLLTVLLDGLGQPEQFGLKLCNGLNVSRGYEPLNFQLQQS